MTHNNESWLIFNNDVSIVGDIRDILTKARADIAHKARGMETVWPVEGYDLQSTLDLLEDMTPREDFRRELERAADELARNRDMAA